MKHKIKVLQVIGGSEFGGAVWIILGYIQMLQEHGFEVLVNTSTQAVADVFRNAGCEIIPIHQMRRQINPVLDAVSIRKLARICRDRDIEIVHTHTSKGGFLGRAAARIAGVPIVIHTAHGFAFHENSSGAAIRTYAGIERMAAHWCDRITTVSDFHRDWALRLKIAPADKIVTVHNGIAPERLELTRDRSDARKELGCDENNILLGVVGRLAAQKGLESMLEVMPKIISERPETRLVIVGEGPVEGKLKNQCKRLGLCNYVVFTGFRSDIGDMLNACDIVLSPSLREGLSVSIMEAMAMGKPLVVTDISSNRELIEDGVSGLVVAPDSPEAIAAAIEIFIADSELSISMGNSAKKRFEANFTETIMKKKLWDLYENLIENRLPDPRD